MAEQSSNTDAGKKSQEQKIESQNSQQQTTTEEGAKNTKGDTEGQEQEGSIKNSK